MKKALSLYALIMFGFFVCTCTVAYAASVPVAPEVDVSLTVGALTLVAGTLAVLRARRKR